MEVWRARVAPSRDKPLACLPAPQVKVAEQGGGGCEISKRCRPVRSCRNLNCRIAPDAHHTHTTPRPVSRAAAAAAAVTER
jgi:hypothetical protein